MPTYTFACDNCQEKWDIKLTFAEHDEKKKDYPCDKCGEQVRQLVAPLRFTLKGEGWFVNSQQNDNPYTITQNELDKNKDKMNYAEDYANRMMEKDDKKLKQG